MPPFLPLWALLSALPWLLPTRILPFTTFYAEVLIASLLLALGAWACWGSYRGHTSAPTQVPALRPPGVALDTPSAVLLALSVVPWLQALSGLFPFPTQAALPSAFLAAAALSWIIARELHEQHGLQAVAALWASLVIAALLSTAVALCQWLLITEWEAWAPPPTVAGRAEANLGQPNNLATLLCWGLIGLWWANARGHIAGAVTIGSAAFLLVGMVLTQSRTAWVALVVLIAVGIAGRKTLGGRKTVLALFALALIFVLMSLGHPPLSRALDLDPPRPAERLANTGARPLIWHLALDAIASRPWGGYGWNQFLVARVELAPEHVDLGLASYAHNLLLDLLVWNGLPLGTLIIVAAAMWLWHRLKGAASAEAWLLLGALLVLGAHAMLELPHAYLLFVLPAAFMAGTLSGVQAIRPIVRIPAFGLAAGLAAAATVWSILIADYRDIEAYEGAMRLHHAKIGSGAKPEPPRPRLLSWMTQSRAVLDQEARGGLSADQLDLWRRTLMRLPALSSLLRFAQASALSGDPAGARWALNVACTLYSRLECESVAAAWREFASRNTTAADVPAPRWRRSH